MRQKQKTKLGFLSNGLRKHTEGCVHKPRPAYVGGGPHTHA